MNGQAASAAYPTLSAEAIRQRALALARFAAWESRQTWALEPALALSGVGFLYDLLPPASRLRPPDPTGVVELHRCLAVLGRPAR